MSSQSPSMIKDTSSDVDPLSRMVPRAGQPRRNLQDVQPKAHRDVGRGEPVISSGQHSHRPLHSKRHPNTSEGDLLGVGPSQRLRRSAQTGSSPNPASPATRHIPTSRHRADGKAASSHGSPLQLVKSRDSTTSWMGDIDSLSKEEIGVAETRFDLMTDTELKEYLDAFDVASRPRRSSSIPQTPAVEGQEQVLGSLLGEDDNLLFPPSPPSGSTHRDMLDHPLRILSRAVRELRESVAALREENRILKAGIDEGQSQIRGEVCMPPALDGDVVGYKHESTPLILAIDT
jgi:hypothetical protein